MHGIICFGFVPPRPLIPPSGCQTGLGQLALFPALPAAVAGGAQDVERALWLRRPFLLPVLENAALLQRLPVRGHGGLPSNTTGPAPSSAPYWQSTLLWTGASQRSGKLLPHCLSTVSSMMTFFSSSCYLLHFIYSTQFQDQNN